jgi:signal transduction histidine kinase
MLDAEMVQQVASAIQSSAATMQSIIDDFLNLQVIKAGAVPLDLKPCSLNVLCAAAVDQFQYQADEKDITLHADLDPGIIDCSADADRLFQVLNNLISNALKYSPQGSSVVVRTRILDGWLRVEVEDNGPGILEEEMPLLFREFTRLRNTPTNGEPSSGVGLSITRHRRDARRSGRGRKYARRWLRFLVRASPAHRITVNGR